jgi:hypothetical protein
MLRFKSTKLNKSQLIAAELLGAGHRPSEVARKLSLRRETISRWKVNQDFILAMNRAHLDVLSNIANDTTMLTSKAHQALLEALDDEEISKVAKATIGIRYLSLVGTQSTIYEKNNKKYAELSKSTENSKEIASWFVDVLEGIEDLKKNEDKITFQELKHKIDDLFNLSNSRPEI